MTSTNQSTDNNQSETNATIGIIQLIKYSVKRYNNDGYNSASDRNTIFYNDLGYRIPIDNVSRLISSEDAQFVNGATFVLDNKEYTVHYEKMSRWFTIN